MIDLSQFVDKQVRVTFENGSKDTGFIIKISGEYTYYPFIFRTEELDTIYTKSGKFNLNCSSYGDIIHIEEMKTMKKYEQLENQVAEMQKEIDRLKREEKNYPKLKLVKIIRTVTYTPEEYFKYCEENDEEPTEEGYVEYFTDSASLKDCFMYSEHHTEEIKVVEN